LLVLFLANLLPIPLASQRLFHALFLTRLQVERMPLNFLDYVFGLNLALKAAEGIFEWFTLLHTYFRQFPNTPRLFLFGLGSYCSLKPASQAHFARIDGYFG
jgi:hypothetical protein